MNGRLFTIDEVADYLGVHRDTVYSLIRSGRLPAMQLGGRKAGWRISQEDVEAFVSEGKARTASQAVDEDQKLDAFDARQRRDLADFQQAQRDERDDFVSGQGANRTLRPT
jgi:excisionase family DNA binding protein